VPFASTSTSASAAALLVIDMQNYTCHREGGLVVSTHSDLTPAEPAYFWTRLERTVVPNLGEAIALCRRGGHLHGHRVLDARLPGQLEGLRHLGPARAQGILGRQGRGSDRARGGRHRPSQDELQRLHEVRSIATTFSRPNPPLALTDQPSLLRPSPHPPPARHTAPTSTTFCVPSASPTSSLGAPSPTSAWSRASEPLATCTTK